MFERALLFGIGCALLACGASRDGSPLGGRGNTVGVSHSGGTGNAGTAADPALGGGGASVAANPSSGGSVAAGVSGASGNEDSGNEDSGNEDGGDNTTGADGGAAVGTGAGAGGTSSAGAAATLADVQAIFDDRCVHCHDSTLTGIPSFPQLSLVEGNAYAALVNRQALETCGGILVVPGDPEQSYLVRKLSDAEPCEGARMPRAFELGVPSPLTATQLATIRAWISAGAKP